MLVHQIYNQSNRVRVLQLRLDLSHTQTLLRTVIQAPSTTVFNYFEFELDVFLYLLLDPFSPFLSAPQQSYQLPNYLPIYFPLDIPASFRLFPYYLLQFVDIILKNHLLVLFKPIFVLFYFESVNILLQLIQSPLQITQIFLFLHLLVVSFNSLQLLFHLGIETDQFLVEQLRLLELVYLFIEFPLYSVKLAKTICHFDLQLRQLHLDALKHRLDPCVVGCKHPHYSLNISLWPITRQLLASRHLMVPKTIVFRLLQPRQFTLDDSTPQLRTVRPQS